MLVKRGVEPFKGHWALLGGYVDWNETVEEAVKREVAEEANVKVISLQHVGIHSNPQRHPKQCVNLSYIVDIAGDPVAGDDAEEIRFFPIKSLPSDLAFDHEEIIKDSLTG